MYNALDINSTPENIYLHICIVSHFDQNAFVHKCTALLLYLSRGFVLSMRVGTQLKIVNVLVSTVNHWWRNALFPLSKHVEVGRI